jgi:hypothetical protein
MSDLSAGGLKKESLQASLAGTIDYAAAFDRGKIAMLGRTYGCHTCGTRYVHDETPGAGM